MPKFLFCCYFKEKKPAIVAISKNYKKKKNEHGKEFFCFICDSILL